MRINVSKLFFASLIISAQSALFSQQVTVLTLDKSIDIALEESYSIKSIKQLVYSAERNLWAARAGYKTYAQSKMYAPVYDEGFKLIEVVEGNPVAKQTGSYQVRGTFDLIQPMPWIPFGGGSLTFRAEGYRLNSWTPSLADPGIDIKSNQFYSSLSAIVEKPLFTINELKLGLQQAELNYERQSKVFKRSELDLVYQVTRSFYQLYRRAQELEINREKVERQEMIYNTTQKKFKAGLAAEVEAMQAEVELVQYQNDLKSSESRKKEQEAAFKQLIGLPLSSTISVMTDLELKPVIVDQEQAVELALNNRSEIVEKLIDIEEQKINIKEIDARVSVKGNIKGYYRFAGFSDAAIPYGATTEDLFNSSWDVLKQTPNRGVTFELEIPVWDWGKNRAQVQAAEATLQRHQLILDDTYVTIKREVQDLVRSVYETYDRVTMLEKNREVSEKSFNISLQRYQNGDITPTDLARANDQLNTAKLSYLSAYIEYKLSLADLQRKTLYDFENKRSLVE